MKRLYISCPGSEKVNKELLRRLNETQKEVEEVL